MAALLLCAAIATSEWQPGLRTLRFISPPNGSTIFGSSLNPSVEIVLDSDLSAEASAAIQRTVEVCYGLDDELSMHCRPINAAQPLSCMAHLPPGAHTLRLRARAGEGSPPGAVQTSGDDVSIIVAESDATWTAHHSGRRRRRGAKPRAQDAVRMVAARAPPLPRYTPEGAVQTRVAVLTLWTVLDGSMLRNGDGKWSPFGYMRPVQLDFVLNLVAREARGGGAWSAAARGSALGTPTVCEIGLNGGHSAAAFLSADPRAVVHSFDIGANKHTATAVELLRATFPRRFVYHEGPSARTVPAFAARLAAGQTLGGACDIVFVDGSHREQDVYADIASMSTAASCAHVVLFDDSATSGLHVGPARAIARAQREGTLAIDRVWEYPIGTHGDNPPVRLVESERAAQPCGASAELSVGWGWSVGHFVRAEGAQCGGAATPRASPSSDRIDVFFPSSKGGVTESSSAEIEGEGVGAERIEWRYASEEARAARYARDATVAYV